MVVIGHIIPILSSCPLFTPIEKSANTDDIFFSLEPTGERSHDIPH
jgi:hypothetical protein